ncbi:MAG: winged helix-turn-helix domain-containing protein [Candidatus Bathyarchaeia archaeon]
MKAHPLYSTENESAFLRVFGSTPQLRIIDFFLDNPHFDFTREEIMGALGMAKRTLARHLPALRDSGLIEVSRRIGRAELYRLNPDSTLAARLRELEEEITANPAYAEAPQIPAGKS